MNATPQQVQKLREMTGAGILDCKKALETSLGDYDKAIQFLREKGKTSAAQKAGRSAGEGLICSWISPDGKKGGLLELNCETDFVARTQDFQELAKRLTEFTGSHSIGNSTALLSQKLDGEPVESMIKEKIGKLGENILIKKAQSFGNGGIIGRYIHAPAEKAPECGRLGVLLEIKSDKDSPEIQELLREVSMQVAASSPKWISKEDVPAAVVEKEIAIYKEQCRQSGKPEKAWDKIIEGKLKDFYKQFCLLEQPHVRDTSGKTTIQSLVESAANRAGASLRVLHFVRFKVGEE